VWPLLVAVEVKTTFHASNNSAHAGDRSGLRRIDLLLLGVVSQFLN
jgi:hypothetical protein